MPRSGNWSDDGAGETLEDLRRVEPVPPPPPDHAPVEAPATDAFEVRASEVARAILDALPEEGAHGSALILRRSVALLESGYARGRQEWPAGSRTAREPEPHRVHISRR